MSRTGHSGWIGVDLDGTLAFYDGWKGPEVIGDPIPAMLARVKAWLGAGERVKIFTARVGVHDPEKVGHDYADKVRALIQDWTQTHIGVRLDVVCQKDFGMIELWDDRAVQVIPNTGERADGK